MNIDDLNQFQLLYYSFITVTVFLFFCTNTWQTLEPLKVRGKEVKIQSGRKG